MGQGLPSMTVGTFGPDSPGSRCRTIRCMAPAEPGTYELVCDLTGHREAGMVGTIEIG